MCLNDSLFCAVWFCKFCVTCEHGEMRNALHKLFWVQVVENLKNKNKNKITLKKISFTLFLQCFFIIDRVGQGRVLYIYIYFFW